MDIRLRRILQLDWAEPEMKNVVYSDYCSQFFGVFRSHLASKFQKCTKMSTHKNFSQQINMGIKKCKILRWFQI